MTPRTLDELLGHVGPLDDSPGLDNGRERFRRFLRESAVSVDDLGAYLRECLERSDEAHTRALQDLLNHIGTRLGFEVEFGPYRRLPGSLGWQGRWISPAGDQVVVATKRHETYADQRPTLARVVEQLIQERRIRGWGRALGLYIVTDSGVDLGHLEKSISSEPNAHPLRIIKPESVLALARLRLGGHLAHDDILTLLRSTSPRLDPLVEMVARLAIGPTAAGRHEEGNELEDIAQSVRRVIERFGDLLVEGLEAVFGSEPWCDSGRQARD